MFNQEFYVGDVVQVDLGARTIAPRWVFSFKGNRAYVIGVKQGFDIYKDEICIEKENDDLYLTKEIYDSEEPYATYTFGDEFSYYIVETIDKGYKYKITFAGAKDNSERTEVFYFVFRKSFYEVQFAMVKAPLFKEPKKYLSYTRTISEDYLVKVGNKFFNDNAFIIPTFSDRLKTAIKNLLFKPKTPEDIMSELIENLKKL